MLPRAPLADSLYPGLLSVAPTGLKRAAVRGSGREKSAKSLASQARHEMDAPKELFAGAKRGRVVTRKSAKVREVARKSAKVHESSHRSGPWLRDVTHCYGWELFFCGRDE